MYSVDCTPTWIVPVPKATDSSSPPPSSTSACGFLNNSASGSELGAPAGSARRFSSFSSLAAALKGERAAPLLACLRPPHFHQDQQTVVLPQRERLAQQEQVLSQQHQQIPQQQGAASFGNVLPVHLQAFPDLIPVQERAPYSTSFHDWLSHNEAEGGAPASGRSKKHQRLSAGNRGKFAADPYRQGGRAAAPRMSTGPSTNNKKPPSPPRTTAAVEADVAAVTGGAADTEDEGTEHLGGLHEDDSNENPGYQALQNALACVVASGRSAELLIWGVRCFIERDFPCLYKPGRSLTGLEISSDLPAKSVASGEGEAACSCGARVHSKLTAGVLAGGKDAAAGRSGDALLLSEQGSVDSTGKLGARNISGTEDGPGVCYNCSAQRSSLAGTSTECCCANGNCLGRQVVVVSVEGHRQRDRRVLKWVRHNLLRAGDVVVLITAWERAEEPKYLRVPGMILSSSVDASTYNLTMATRLTSRVKQLGAALLSDCRVYPLVVPLARATKAPVGNLLCQSARELQADLLVVGSHGHTSLRQVLCGSVSRHVRSHAPCRVVMPRV